MIYESRHPDVLTRLRLLDLFSGAGGAAMGYHRAGFEVVVGVDIVDQPRYPFEFHQGDALDVLARLVAGETWEGYTLADFDAIHASPPCQGYSRMRHLPWLAGREYPLLIEPVRRLLALAAVPWVIENVEDSPLERRTTLFGPHGVLLCGTMFRLPIYRHRPFESSLPLPQPPHRRHEHVIAPGRMFGARQRIATGRSAMGIDWMRRDELAQAIPPAYTQWIGERLLEAIGAAA